MTILDELQAVMREPLSDSDGERIELFLLPPATSAEVEELTRIAGGVLDEELRELLAVTRGFSGGPMEALDLSGRGFDMGADLFPRLHPIACDGTGNFWIVDLDQPSPLLGPVYYLCHDPAVAVYQADSTAELIRELLKACRPPHESSILRVYEHESFRIWRDDPYAIPFEQAVSSGDPALSDFALQLDPSWVVFDLRNPVPGKGIAWGRWRFEAGEARRAGAGLPIFALRRRYSFLRRLFGRS